MSPSHARELLDALTRAESTSEGADHDQRQFRRFAVRGEASLEPLDADPDAEAGPTILLRDISHGGLGFVCHEPLEPGSTWRVRFREPRRTNAYFVGSQPISVRHCRRVQTGVYLIGGQFIIEPYLLSFLGVRQHDLGQPPAGAGASPAADAAFLPPDDLDG